MLSFSFIFAFANGNAFLPNINGDGECPVMLWTMLCYDLVCGCSPEVLLCYLLKAALVVYDDAITPYELNSLAQETEHKISRGF